MIHFIFAAISRTRTLRLLRRQLSATKLCPKVTFLGTVPFLSQASNTKATYNRKRALAATRLAVEGYKPFKKRFPGLEYPAAFSFQSDLCAYREGGALHPIVSSWVEIEMPLYEVLSEFEEKRLGESGISKPQVGKIIMRGRCTANCVKVDLEKMTVVSNDGRLIWEYVTGGMK